MTSLQDGVTSLQDYDAAMDRAMKYLGPRARSRRDVAQTLGRNGFKPQIVEDVLSRLEELSILNEATFAADAARQGRARGKGAMAVKRDLLSRGISAQTIEAAVADAFPPESEHDLVLQAASKKAAGLAGLSIQTQYRRLAAYLTRRGHDPEIVSEVCRTVLGDFAKSD